MKNTKLLILLLVITVGLIVALKVYRKKMAPPSDVTEETTGKEKVMVKMETSLGTIELELDTEKAPKSVANFVEYAKAGFYDGTIFHRVIDGFMIQGGGFDAEMNQKETRAPISNEADNGLGNTPMTIAMARTNDPHSATSQFFINLVDNSRLNYQGPDQMGYAVFGRVTKGEDVVAKIGKAKTTTKGFYQNVPEETITITKVTVE